MQRYAYKLLINLILFGLASTGYGQVHKTDQIEVELISETTNVVAGETLWLGIRLDPADHWHTYWKFGGDSGVATFTSDWEIADGAEIGDIVWPIPEWTPFLGSELVTFTYEREVILPIPVTIPSDFEGASFDLRTKIDWQVCEEICIPGDAEFSLSLPVASSLEIDERWVASFMDTRDLTPVAIDQHNLLSKFNAHDDKVNVMVSAFNGEFENVDEAYFFPTERRIMKYAPFRKVILDGDRIQISTEQHRRYPDDLSELVGTLKLIDDDGKTSSGTVSVTTTSPSGELTWTIDEDTGVTFSIEPSHRTGKCTSAGDGTTYGLCFATYYCVLYKSSSDTVAKKQYASLMFDNANGKWRFVASMEQVATCF